MKKEAKDVPMPTGRAAIPCCPFPLPSPVSRHSPARPHEEVAATNGLEGCSDSFGRPYEETLRGDTRSNPEGDIQSSPALMRA